MENNNNNNKEEDENSRLAFLLAEDDDDEDDLHLSFSTTEQNGVNLNLDLDLDLNLDLDLSYLHEETDLTPNPPLHEDDINSKNNTSTTFYNKEFQEGEKKKVSDDDQIKRTTNFSISDEEWIHEHDLLQLDESNILDDKEQQQQVRHKRALSDEDDIDELMKGWGLPPSVANNLQHHKVQNTKNKNHNHKQNEIDKNIERSNFVSSQDIGRENQEQYMKVQSNQNKEMGKEFIMGDNSNSLYNNEFPNQKRERKVNQKIVEQNPNNNNNNNLPSFLINTATTSIKLGKQHLASWLPNEIDSVNFQELKMTPPTPFNLHVTNPDYNSQLKQNLDILKEKPNTKDLSRHQFFPPYLQNTINVSKESPEAFSSLLRQNNKDFSEDLSSVKNIISNHLLNMKEELRTSTDQYSHEQQNQQPNQFTASTQISNNLIYNPLGTILPFPFATKYKFPPIYDPTVKDNAFMTNVITNSLSGALSLLRTMQIQVRPDIKRNQIFEVLDTIFMGFGLVITCRQGNYYIVAMKNSITATCMGIQKFIHEKEHHQIGEKEGNFSTGGGSGSLFGGLGNFVKNTINTSTVKTIDLLQNIEIDKHVDNFTTNISAFNDRVNEKTGINLNLSPTKTSSSPISKIKERGQSGTSGSNLLNLDNDNENENDVNSTTFSSSVSPTTKILSTSSPSRSKVVNTSSMSMGYKWDTIIINLGIDITTLPTVNRILTIQLLGDASSNAPYFATATPTFGVGNSLLTHIASGLYEASCLAYQYPSPHLISENKSNSSFEKKIPHDDSNNADDNSIDLDYILDIQTYLALELQQELTLFASPLDHKLKGFELACARLMTTLQPIYQRMKMDIPRPTRAMGLSSFPLTISDPHHIYTNQSLMEILPLSSGSTNTKGGSGSGSKSGSTNTNGGSRTGSNQEASYEKYKGIANDILQKIYGEYYGNYGFFSNPSYQMSSTLKQNPHSKEAYHVTRTVICAALWFELYKWGKQEANSRTRRKQLQSDARLLNVRKHEQELIYSLRDGKPYSINISTTDVTANVVPSQSSTSSIWSSLSSSLSSSPLNSLPLDSSTIAFHTLFRIASQDERLIFDVNATYQARLGKLYITMYGLYFHSNLLGFVQQKIIPWYTVKHIEDGNNQLPIVLRLKQPEEEGNTKNMTVTNRPINREEEIVSFAITAMVPPDIGERTLDVIKAVFRLFIKENKNRNNNHFLENDSKNVSLKTEEETSNRNRQKKKKPIRQILDV